MEKIFEIENGVLKKYNGYVEIIIPDGVKIIGEKAFYNCHKINRVIIPEGVKKIENRAFNFCSNLSEVVIPNSVTSIGQSAFSECSLKNVELPSGLKTIGNFAFTDCNELKNINIPNSLTSIGESVFVNTDKLKYNDFDNARYLGNKQNPYLVLVNAKNENILTCKIHENTKLISPYAFYNCSKLSNIEIPEKVEFIGKGAFDTCENLSSIKIPKSVKNIGKDIFMDCLDVTIYCPAGSNVEKYAKENGIKFENI